MYELEDGGALEDAGCAAVESLGGVRPRFVAHRVLYRLGCDCEKIIGPTDALPADGTVCGKRVVE